MNKDDKVKYLAGLPTLTLHEAEFLAKEWKMEHPLKKCLFDLCGPKGSTPAWWLDPHYGFFTLEKDPKHFLTVSSCEDYGVHVENMRPAKEDD